MMEDSFERIITLFSLLFQWFLAVFGVNRPLVIEKQKPHVATTYGDKYKSDFLLTYQEDVDVDWNSNIDAVIRDPAQLADALSEANNVYEKIWRSRILIETTPRGNVIMFYDLYKRAFSYYCDNGTMPYDTMNAVAMKYVVMFRCRDFFVDSQILPKPIFDLRDSLRCAKEISPANPRTSTTSCPAFFAEVVDETEIKTNVPFSKQPAKLNLDKTAFVRLKSYNTATKKAGVSKEDDKVINCFLHLGASRNWVPITKKVKANPLNGFKTDMIPGATNNNKMSYLEYKRLQNK